jgi:hypothetical protein
MDVSIVQWFELSNKSNTQCILLPQVIVDQSFFSRAKHEIMIIIGEHQIQTKCNFFVDIKSFCLCNCLLGYKYSPRGKTRPSKL